VRLGDHRMLSSLASGCRAFVSSIAIWFPADDRGFITYSWSHSRRAERDPQFHGDGAPDGQMEGSINRLTMVDSITIVSQKKHSLIATQIY